MKDIRARQILQSLIQGTHPQTGDELPPDSVLQNAEVLRALLSATAALDASTARAARRAQLPHNVGKQWSEDEDGSLMAAFQRGDTLADIATAHSRTIRAIEARLQRLGFLSGNPGTFGLSDPSSPPAADDTTHQKTNSVDPNSAS